jgi:hypothetical protein
MSSSQSYPRKVAVLTEFDEYVEVVVDDLLPSPAPFMALFPTDGHFTPDMIDQVFEAFKPYMLPNEDMWVFGYHSGKYQAAKLCWEYGGYEAETLSDLLRLIVSRYYCYSEGEV